MDCDKPPAQTLARMHSGLLDHVFWQLDIGIQEWLEGRRKAAEPALTIRSVLWIESLIYETPVAATRDTTSDIQNSRKVKTD